LTVIDILALNTCIHYVFKRKPNLAQKLAPLPFGTNWCHFMENKSHRIKQDHQLKPSLTRTFNFSNHPKFLEKLIDVVGIHPILPQKAIVLCLTEIALNRAGNETRTVRQ
jgi:hypothetical protein